MSATVIARSSELGPVELAPTTLGRGQLALARTDRARYAEHE